MKKRAFTLTELLVVVVIIGVLSAVVLPKFTKVIETRKTTEAENILSAVRSEQEARCTLDKLYTTDATQLAAMPKNLGSNYDYQLNKEGMSARSFNKNYSLQILSYSDGRVCCSGSYCEQLGKKYPKCDELANVKYDSSCVEDVPDTPCTLQTRITPCPQGQTGEGIIETVNYETCTYNAPVNECEDLIGFEKTSCDDTQTEGEKEVSCPCGTGKRRWHCGTDTGYQWESTDTQPCAPKPPAETKNCDTGNGTQTMNYVCENGNWVEGEWEGDCGSSGCTVPVQTTETQSCGCTNSGTKTRNFDEQTCGWDEWSTCSEEENNCSCKWETLGHFTKGDMDITLQNVTGQEYADTACRLAAAEAGWGGYPRCQDVDLDSFQNESCTICGFYVLGYRRDRVYSGTKKVKSVYVELRQCTIGATSSSDTTGRGRR